MSLKPEEKFWEITVDDLDNKFPDGVKDSVGSEMADYNQHGYVHVHNLEYSSSNTCQARVAVYHIETIHALRSTFEKHGLFTTFRQLSSIQQ